MMWWSEADLKICLTSATRYCTSHITEPKNLSSLSLIYHSFTLLFSQVKAFPRNLIYPISISAIKLLKARKLLSALNLPLSFSSCPLISLKSSPITHLSPPSAFSYSIQPIVVAFLVPQYCNEQKLPQNYPLDHQILFEPQYKNQSSKFFIC